MSKKILGYGVTLAIAGAAGWSWRVSLAS